MGEPVYENIETYAAPQEVIMEPTVIVEPSITETVVDTIVTEHVEPMETTITEPVVADTIVTEAITYGAPEEAITYGAPEEAITYGAPEEVIVQPAVTESVAQNIVITQARIPIVTATPLKTKKKKHAGCC